METPFTTLFRKGETGDFSTTGLFQDTTMRCVKREEKRSLVIIVKSEKNSNVILDGFFSLQGVYFYSSH